MFNQHDIKSVQEVRPDLTSEQADEVLGFLCDMTDQGIEFNIEKTILFKQTADYIFPTIKT
jgi:hypothetical protein